MATEEKKSNIVATEQISAGLEQATGKVTKSEAEIPSDPSLIEATPSAEHTPVAIHPQVQEAGVIVVQEPHHEILSGTEVSAGDVDGSGVIFPPKESTIIKKLFDSRKNLGPADNSSTWGGLEKIRGKLLKFVRERQQKAA